VDVLEDADKVGDVDNWEVVPVLVTVASVAPKDVDVSVTCDAEAVSVTVAVVVVDEVVTVVPVNDA
jgi:hypothetical protein